MAPEAPAAAETTTMTMTAAAVAATTLTATAVTTTMTVATAAVGMAAAASSQMGSTTAGERRQRDGFEDGEIGSPMATVHRIDNSQRRKWGGNNEKER